jgi:riboflavin synthase
MFTGIVTDIGELIARDGGRLSIRCRYPAGGIAIGASIACDGACLTVTGSTAAGQGSTFTADVSNETVSRTTIGEWSAGRTINLERPLRAGEELGGHILTGHIDGTGRILAVQADGPSRRWTVEVPQQLARYFAAKGSVALDGVSLTVNEAEQNRFGVNIIPHTLTRTTLGSKKPGDRVNVEIDLFARYLARLLELRQ